MIPHLYSEPLFRLNAQWCCVLPLCDAASVPAMMDNVVDEVSLDLQPCAAIIRTQSHLAALEPTVPLT